jgi:hypothetical protein
VDEVVDEDEAVDAVLETEEPEQQSRPVRAMPQMLPPQARMPEPARLKEHLLDLQNVVVLDSSICSTEFHHTSSPAFEIARNSRAIRQNQRVCKRGRGNCQYHATTTSSASFFIVSSSHQLVRNS